MLVRVILGVLACVCVLVVFVDLDCVVPVLLVFGGGVVGVIVITCSYRYFVVDDCFWYVVDMRMMILGILMMICVDYCC